MNPYYTKTLQDQSDNQTDYVKHIDELRKEKDAIILAHYYQTPDIQEVADFLGDSLALSQKAQETQASIIVFCGVHFMAETAKIINPNKRVFLPDLKAGCSLSDSCPPEALAKWKAQHPDHTVITYINTSAGVKALSDIIVTSSNAEKIIGSFPQDEKILFVPDKNMGTYFNKKLGRNMKLWEGSCMVHEAFSLEKIERLIVANPGCKVIAHPESDMSVLRIADFIGSTTALLKYVQRDQTADTYIIATEVGILHEMRKKAPHKKLIDAPVEDSYACNCSECFHMKVNTMKKLYLCLKNETPEIILSPELIQQALPPLHKMLEISKQR